MMTAEADVNWTADAQDLSAVLGCSVDVVERMRNLGFLSPHGDLSNLAPSRDYVRDAAWAAQVWG